MSAHVLEDALQEDYILGRYNLGTDTVGSTIELEGTVQYLDELDRAIDMAHQLAPGYRIISRIYVEYPD